jgi:archaellum component FlaF (FlaF/FlaG flagellin family)
MGFSTAVATAILFSSIIFLFVTLYQVVNISYDEYWEVTDDKRLRDEEAVATELTITAVQYDKFTNNLTIIIENSGDTVLNPSHITALINGAIVSRADMNITVRDGLQTSVWLPNEHAILNISAPELVYKPDIDPRIYLTVTAGLTAPWNISLSAERVYIIDDGTHIDMFTRYGMMLATLVDPIVTAPQDLGVGANYIYVINGTETVYRFNFDGTGRTELISQATLGAPTAIAVTAQHIYVVNNTNSIYRFELDGTGKTLLVPETANYVPTDIYVTDYIYIIHNFDSIIQFELDGSGAVEIISSGGELTSPSAIAVSDEDFVEQYIYIIDNNNHLDVYEIDGTYNSTITNGLSSGAMAVDVQDKLYLSDLNNGLVILNLGTPLKLVTENGIDAHVMI